MATRHKTRWSLAVGLVVFPCFVGVPSTAADSSVGDGRDVCVDMVDIGAPGVGVRAERISDRGVVVANYTDSSGNQRAFRWMDGSFSELQGLGGPITRAEAINIRGQIVGGGAGAGPEFETHALLWEPDGSLVDLGVPGEFSFATGINRRGTVVGMSGTPEGTVHAVVWSDGVTTDLGDLGSGFSSPAYPYGINDADEVAVESSDASGIPRGFLWDDGTVTPLTVADGSGTFPRVINRKGQVLGSVYGAPLAVVWDGSEETFVRPFGGDVITPIALNRRGDVAGVASTNREFEFHAFLWQDGVLTDLGTLDGGNSEAVAMNDRGLIVGGSSTASGDHSPVAWDDAQIIDLGSLGGRFGIALDVNEKGQIVGYSQDAEGVERAVLWALSRGPSCRAVR